MDDKTQLLRDFLLAKIQQTARTKGIPLPTVTDEFSIVESGLFDSLGFVQLVAAIETEFQVEVDFGDLDPEQFTTVGGLVRSVGDSIQKQSPSA